MIQPSTPISARRTKERTTADFHRERAKQGLAVGLINLGCARNLVDAQSLLGRLKKGGHRVVDMDHADVAVVNTCGFIEEAKKESIDTILECVDLKKQGKIRKIVVAGCLAQRYGKELATQIKEIDAIIGVPRLEHNGASSAVSLTPGHYAYVKICESCYNQCRFCAIPKIKGKFSSRTIASIVDEVKALEQRGVKEVNIIGQDITAYGMDLYHEFSLARLLKELVKATKNIRWFRLLYTFPAHVTDELIDVIAGEERICNYIDMPLQHISDSLLLSMHRSITTDQTRDLIARIRASIPMGSLRTTFIVGLPGETETDFQELLDFVATTRFEKVGVFVYSREEGTPAYDMPQQVPETVKKRRLDILMRRQQVISRIKQEQFIGQTLKVLIDEVAKDQKNIYLGRTEYDAPEVDGIVYVHSPKKLRPGDFVAVKITDALEYDLVAETL